MNHVDQQFEPGQFFNELLIPSLSYKTLLTKYGGEEGILRVLENALKLLGKHKYCRPATIRLSHMAKENNFELFKKITGIALCNRVIPGVSCESPIAAYATMNLTPICSVPGKYGGYLITVQVNRDFKNNHASLWKYLPHQTRCNKKSYSDNLGSSKDPQGDVNWMRFLPDNMREFFGFSFDQSSDTFTFPDIHEANGAIETFNLKGKPFNKHIPLKLAEVTGQLTSLEDYLTYFSEGKLPIASPEFGQSWFYHDYFYHFIGMLQVPTEVLELMIDLSQHVLKAPTKDCIYLCSSILDHSTTWAFRIRGLEYISKHPDYDFYFYQDVSNISKVLNETIHQFAYLANEMQLSGLSEERKKEIIDRIYSKMNQPGFFDYVRNIHSETSAEGAVNTGLATRVRNHCEKMEGVASWVLVQKIRD